MIQITIFYNVYLDIFRKKSVIHYNPTLQLSYCAIHILNPSAVCRATVWKYAPTGKIDKLSEIIIKSLK